MSVSNRHMHIIVFDNPYPPNYGGAIDMYYKIEALSALGIKIDLHILYNKRNDVSKLETLCETVSMYKTKKMFWKHFSLQPFSVKTRNIKALNRNLKNCDAPILFESLRTCAIFKSHSFKQKVAVRCHSIEHNYSWGLSKSEFNWIKKSAHYVEGYKQKYFESVLNKADVLFPISKFELRYFSENYKPKSIFLPPFKGEKEVISKEGFGKYALYHGDLSISDNIKSALFIIDVFSELDKKLIIASYTIVPKILREIERYSNITFEHITNPNKLQVCIQNAHINALYSYQESGTKLKVYTALLYGRHCIVNKNIVDDESILSICNIANSKSEYQKLVRNLFNEEFIVTQDRIKTLKAQSDRESAKKIIAALY